jgi:hypothetical protein
VAIAPEPPRSPAPELQATPVVTPDECALIGATGEPITTVVLTDRIDPSRAPRPSNESERLLFRQVYETLVRADCMGRVVSGLAASWRLDADGSTWIVTLREGARFADGTPVTAGDVRASWTRGGELLPHVSRLVQSVVPVGDAALAIGLRHHGKDAPIALAHPDLAVARPAADSPWPLGTMASRVAPDGDKAAALITLTRDGLPDLRFLAAPGDPRDLLDRGVDLLLTRDPAALDYAATLPDLQSVPLAWLRTQVLLARGRPPAAPYPSEAARQALADDAIRGDGRGARGPSWWQMRPECEIATAPQREQPVATPRIVYDTGDAAARDLAERLAGLARRSDPVATAFLDLLLPNRPSQTVLRAAGLSGEALAAARRRGTDAGYVISVDSRPIAPCRDLEALIASAPWLDPETIVPLVDTRLHAIVRRGRSGLTADWDGGLAIAGPNGPR